jgi:hypothetical protein
VQEFVNVALGKFSVPLTAADCRQYLEQVLGPLWRISPTPGALPWCPGHPGTVRIRLLRQRDRGLRAGGGMPHALLARPTRRPGVRRPHGGGSLRGLNGGCCRYVRPLGGRRRGSSLSGVAAPPKRGPSVAEVLQSFQRQ